MSKYHPPGTPLPGQWAPWVIAPPPLSASNYIGIGSGSMGSAMTVNEVDDAVRRPRWWGRMVEGDKAGGVAIGLHLFLTMNGMLLAATHTHGLQAVVAGASLGMAALASFVGILLTGQLAKETRALRVRYYLRTGERP